MPVDLKLWTDTFSSLPAWQCPSCGRGRVISGTPVAIEPAYSAEAQSHDDCDPEQVVQRFTAVLRCNYPQCGEIVAVIGDIKNLSDEYGSSFVSLLRPAAIFPAPHIINIPEETPQEVRKELVRAFQLFWGDLGASAMRIRTSVERLLDNFSVAKTTINQQKKRVYIPLASRIDIFSKNHPDHAEALTALRFVGNLGTHSDVAPQSVLAAFEVYEEALAEIYGRRSKKVARARKRLIKGKGKLKKR
jgi:Domain of unknown function (DUF4145)